MTVSVTYNSNLTTNETLTTNATHQATDATVIASGLNKTLTAQGSGSTPPCTVRAGADFDVSGATIDLTALVGTNGAAVSGSGLRVQFAKFVNKSTNANNITIAEGASNGYDGFGAAFSIILVPGAEILIRTNDAGSDIGGTKKILDITGTGSQVLQYEIVMG